MVRKLIFILSSFYTTILFGQYGTFFQNSISSISEYDANEFVTRWTIPTGSFTFPTQNDGTFNAEIKFGDETDWLTITSYNDADLTQTLTGGEYVIRIRGTFPNIYINGSSVKDYITEVIQWGDVSFTTLYKGFWQASNLDALPDTAITGMADCNSLYGTFLQTGITSIPKGFLDSATAVLTCEKLFYQCPITGTIDSILFKYVTLCISFRDVFYQVTGITGNIPDFKYNTLTTIFRQAFYGCTGMDGSIPPFSTNTAVVDFYKMFYNCDLTGSSQSLWLEGNNTLIPPNYDSGTPNGQDCYFGNSNLTDYVSIPTFWK